MAMMISELTLSNLTSLQDITKPENILSWKWHKKTPDEFKATFTVKSNDHVNVVFTRRDTVDNDWELEFTRTSPVTKQQTVIATASGHAFEIFATVFNIILHFVKDVEPDSVMVWSLERRKNDPRTKLYDKMFSILPEKFGYKLDGRADVGGSVVWILKRIEAD
jgi:hypothetical protein